MNQQPPGVAQQNQVLDLVRSLKNHGLGIIIISHQMHDIFKVADRILVMRRGKLVANVQRQGTNPDEIVRHIVGTESVD